MEPGNTPNTSLVPVNIEDEIKKSYLDYAMSVIVGRALPDARDGLKPVHRRILHAMNELGNAHNKPYKKSARIVGDVIGKYHPHGDSAVYDAIVRMVQDFSMRYPLVDGQGNFGSVDGDSAAAMRYTEIRMDRVAEEVLADIEKETVNFVPNYDESLSEPEVLPTRIPNLLVNGSSGIAVGMATNVPPHNLSEVVNALIHLIDHKEATIDELMQFIPGPDFPTAGFIYGRSGIREAYRTGRGIIRLRAKASFEDTGRGRKAIIITEIPYQVNKARLIEQIASLVKDEKKIEGITEIRDESDREGMRVVIELRRDEEPEIVLNQLFKHTNMQTSFGINFLAIDHGQPKVLNLRQALMIFLDHRREVVTRRTRFELRKAREREHILEGLKIALDNLDEVITIIRQSKTPPEAKESLCTRFALSVIQAQAILDMRLQRLTNMEREKILDELAQIRLIIADLLAILADESRLMEVIRGELQEVKKTFGDNRRTKIVDEAADIAIEDLIPDEDSVITVSSTGYIKRTPASTYRVQRRGGKGRRGMTTNSEDFTRHAFVASNHSYLLVFTDRGRLYWLKVYEIPEVGATGKGRPIVNLLRMEPDENLMDILATKDFPEDEYVVFATAQGTIKKTPLSEFSNPRSSGIIAQTIREDDRLVAVCKTSGRHQIFLATRNGQSIRFPESDVRPMGRVAAGVIGIKLHDSDEVVGMTTLDDSGQILTMNLNGYGKKTPSSEYRVQSRSGSGIINVNVARKNGHVVGTCFLKEDSNLILVTAAGQIIRMNTANIRVAGRNTIGVKLIDLDPGDTVTSWTLLAPEDDQDLMEEAGAEGFVDADESSDSVGDPQDE